MEVMRQATRPPTRRRLSGGMDEAVLLCSSPAEGSWELVEATLRAGTSVLPVPFPTEELGIVLSGSVQLIELPFDYDVGIPLDEQAETHILGPGDAFRFSPGDRIWMEVVSDLRLVYARRRSQEQGGSC